MALKLKLKVPSSNSGGGSGQSNGTRPANAAGSSQGGTESSGPSLPKLKIKPPSSKNVHGGGVSKKPHDSKEKLKKLKINLSNPLANSSEKSSTTNFIQPSAAATSSRGIKSGKVTNIRIKPTRIPGEGYDAEAPDLEDDPLIEEGIVVRFLNDTNIEAVQSAVDTGDLSNIFIKWLTKEKAAVHVNQTLYAARLVDLPTVTELYKTVDKKNIYKTIDICQILLVLRPINPENFSIDSDFEVPVENTYPHPLYKMSPNNEINQSRIVHKDGLSYPYEGVHRRFKPRKVNHRVMDDIDSRVNEIIKRDNKAEESHYELADLSKINRFGSSSATPSTVNTPMPVPKTPIESAAPLKPEQPSAGKDNEEGAQLQNDVDLLESALQQELDALESDDGDGDDDNRDNDLITTEGRLDDNTSSQMEPKNEQDEDDDDEDDMNDLFEGTIEDEEQNHGHEEEDDDDDDDGEDEEDDDDDDEEEDENVKEEKSKAKKLEEDIADLGQVLKAQKEKYGNNPNKMIQMKYHSNVGTLKGQIEIKRRELAKIRDEQHRLQEKSEPNHARDPNSGSQQQQQQQRQGEDDNEDENEDDDDDDDGHEHDNDDDDNLDGLF